uniref:Uncharacterized protein n=1 Tax=Oryza glumipatula TaxID=40148 RepID=A0A0E0AKZ5_9ORYZ
MLAGYVYGGILAVVLAAVVVTLPPPATAAPVAECDPGVANTNVTGNSAFDRNLGLLAAALAANASAAGAPGGYAEGAAGAAPDQVIYALALCRGDVNASACRACVEAAFVDAKDVCPGGISLYEDACLIRFTGQSFMDFLRPDKWQVSQMTFNPKIYGFAQCVPVLTPEQCKECLRSLHDNAKAVYMGNSLRWVGMYSVWCRLMYSVRLFYGGRATLQLSAPPPPAVETPAEAGAGKKKSAAGVAAGLACSVLVLLILSAFAFVRFKRRTKAVEADHPLKKITRAQCMIFDLPTLQEATENFSENNKLGEGGFGSVYKLHNEVLLLAELQHKNLVRLHGFCLHQGETLLVYEYIKNGSLDNLLFDINRGNALNWEQQYNIILGIAKGILYLHEDSSLRIIHRDLKSNNILLGEDMEPKIADFGLARLLGEGHTHTRTTRVVGTFGYMAPEYAIDGNVSTKIDIFSFGVLVLEIVTRRRNCNSDDHDLVNLLSDVWNCWTKGTVSQMIDQSLHGYSQSQALRCIHIALLCVQSDPNDRPQISSVIFMLTRQNMELQPPAQPAFFFGGGSASSSPSFGQRSYVYDRCGFDNISVNGVTLTEPYPR